MDALSSVLNLVRLSAGVFSRATLREPWAVSSQQRGTPLFHVVVSGVGRIETGDRPDVHWSSGDVLVLPHGHAHVLRAGPPVPPCDIGALPTVRSHDGRAEVVAGAEGSPTRLLCGTFSLHPAAASFVLDALPPLVHIAPRSTVTSSWLDQSLSLLAREEEESTPGAAAMSQRLAEILVVHIMRAHLDHQTRAGWLAACADPRLATPMAEIHEHPASDHSIPNLARAAGMSRSVFYDRFRAAVGEAPGAYVTRWRMVVARMALSDGATLQQAADRVGYGSEAAFCRAFKRCVGVSPRAWSRQRSA